MVHIESGCLRVRSASIRGVSLAVGVLCWFSGRVLGGGGGCVKIKKLGGDGEGGGGEKR
jgi:hypothetical protein